MAKRISREKPAPVDVKASVPLEIKVADESIKALSDTAASSKPPTLESIAKSAEPTPVLIAAEQPPVPMTIENIPDEPVIVASDKPLLVTLDAESLKGAADIANKSNGKEGHEKPLPTVIKGEGVTLSPTTTEQDDLVTESQRRINLIWETTQSRIALIVVGAGILVNTGVVAMTLFSGREVSVTQLSIISGSLQFLNLTVGIVIGFYFSRINHQARGGVGAQPELEAYTGR